MPYVAVDILPGYTWERNTGRYRSNATGKFVARRDILHLLEAQITASEEDLGELTTAVHEGRIAPATWQEQTRTTLRRLVLAQLALGAGGWDRLTPLDFGRAGSDLRQLYARIAGTARDIVDSRITLRQALARANEYAGHARSHFYQAERERVQPSASNLVLIERRVLSARGKTCNDCIRFYDRGWQHLGVLPPPGSDSVCGGNCKCSLLRMEVEAATVARMAGQQTIKPVPYGTGLNSNQNRVTMTQEVQVMVNRADLEKEHSLLIARLHQLRRQLGYPPLTGKEERRQAHK